MFNPKYLISNRLLANIKRISTISFELNHNHFPDVVLVDFEKNAMAVSSYASTSIEGNPLPLTEVKKILKSKPAVLRDSETEVINYNLALKDLNGQIGRGELTLSLKLILDIHRQVMKGLLPSNQVGKLRQQPVVVNDPRTGNIVYLPPDVKDVKLLVQELIAYTHENRGTTDPLILAGIFHKQMVLIHPFMDGNGRTTRLATKVLLAQMGLNTFNLFSFENYYNKNVTRYFQHVGAFGNYYDIADSIEFTAWLEYFTEGMIDELLRVQKLLGQAEISPEARLKPYHEKILDFIRQTGLITDRDYSKITERAKATRSLDFQKLISLGLIIKKGKGRATYYVINKDNIN